MFVRMRFIQRIKFHCFRLKSTSSMQKDSAKNANVVRLIGSVATEVFKTSLTNKPKLFLRTMDSECFYEMHNIVISNRVIEYLPEVLKTDQQLLVNGRLKVDQFLKDDCKIGTKFRIEANSIYICDDGKPEVHKDINNANTINSEQLPIIDSTVFEIRHQNHVYLNSFVWSEITNEEKFSSFHIAMRYLAHGKEKTDIISVFAYDDLPRNTLRYHVKRLDHIQIEGILQYKQCIDANGKKQYNGYINATRITKLTTLRYANSKEQRISN